MTAEHEPPAKVAIMVNHAAQYFAPAFRAFSARSGLHERVYYWTVPTNGYFDVGFGRHVEWKTDLYSHYRWWTPSAKPSKTLTRMVQVYRDLRVYRPHALLCFGWSSPVAIAGLLYGRLAGLPILVYGDTNGRQPATTLRGRLRAPVLRALFTQVAGALSTGPANAQFYRNHGLPDGRIHHGTLPIAMGPFRAAGIRHAESRSETGSGRQLVVGFAGKLVTQKGADELVEAVSMLQRDGSWVLRIIGDGPERENLEHQVAQLSLQHHVEFCGFKNTDELPDCLAKMDIFAMPSRWEPRGLVAIEAMAAGTVPVVSSATGVWGEDDAVQEGITGFIYPAGRPDLLAVVLSRLLKDHQLRTDASERARARAVEFGPEAFVRHASSALTREIYHYQSCRTVWPYRDRGASVDEGAGQTADCL